MTTSPSDSRGFTLVEMMMAMLILTVGLLGLLQSIEVAFEHNARNRVREAAVLLAEEEMSKFRLHPTVNTVSTARRVIGGVKRKFTVIKESHPVGQSNRLRVAVHWGFRNATTTHEIYSFKR